MLGVAEKGASESSVRSNFVYTHSNVVTGFYMDHDIITCTVRALQHIGAEEMDTETDDEIHSIYKVWETLFYT